MTRAVDLDASLLRVRALFDCRQRIQIAWVDLDEVSERFFDEPIDLAAITYRDGQALIGVHPRLRHAPQYVVDYLVGHEMLHIALGTFDHPRAFGVAERLLPGYLRATAWLEAHD
jgi:hypothetical protein